MRISWNKNVESDRSNFVFLSPSPTPTPLSLPTRSAYCSLQKYSSLILDEGISRVALGLLKLAPKVTYFYVCATCSLNYIRKALERSNILLNASAYDQGFHSSLKTGNNPKYAASLVYSISEFPELQLT